MNTWSTSYTLRTDAPPPVPWASYAESARDSLGRLLESASDARQIQEFLERNPCFVPGAWTPGVKSGHYPLHCALITQPRLVGLDGRQPDFMWLATHSQTWYPTLVAIARPDKPLFTKKGSPTAEFTQARHQLAQWDSWLNTAENLQKFAVDCGIPDIYTRYKTLQPHFVLICGRRREVEDRPDLSKELSGLLPGPDEELVSYDLLSPDVELSQAITVKATAPGQYEALHVLPTLTLGPRLADRLLSVTAMEDAIAGCWQMPPERREFLVSRLEYWREWAQQEGSRKARLNDFE